MKNIFKFSSKNKRSETINQIIKYFASGGVYFWVGYGVFAVGYSVYHLWWFWAKVIADIIGWTLNYILQRYWTFASQSKYLSEEKHLKRYFVITVIAFIIDYLIIGGLKAIGISPYIGFFISSGFFTIWSYLWYKYWVFARAE